MHRFAYGLLLCSLVLQPARAQILKVGDLAPDFSLDALDTTSISLKDFRGKVVFLNFFGYN